jgi:hypothetical protein
VALRLVERGAQGKRNRLEKPEEGGALLDGEHGKKQIGWRLMHGCAISYA